MAKIKKIIEFVLALLNFLFHFKPTPDEEVSVVAETYPAPATTSGKARTAPLFEPIP